MNASKPASPFARLFGQPTATVATPMEPEKRAAPEAPAAKAAPAAVPATDRVVAASGAKAVTLAVSAAAQPVMHAAAPTLSDGFAGGFVEGPLSEPDPHWVRGGFFPFVIERGGRSQLNLDELLRFAEDIDPVMYGELCTHLESIEMQVAMGQDALPGFDERHDLLVRVLQSCGWTFDPDEGVVPAPGRHRAAARAQ